MWKNLTTKLSNTSFVKNKKSHIIIFTITLIALCVRLLNIDKPFGLWYDEMLTYIFSSKSFPLGIIHSLLREDFHMPLYYLFVNRWMYFLGSSDIALRLSSVFWGTLTIPALFCLGKTYKSEKLGYLLAIVGCLSPIMIYYSQEVRFYSMLMCFSTLSLIYFLKLLDAPNKKNYTLFGIINLVILYIYTLGIIFVAIETLVLFIHNYLHKEEKFCENFKKFIYYNALFLVLAIPYLFLLISNIILSKQTILLPFSWGQTSSSVSIFLLNDWFSPFIAGQYGQDPSVYGNFIKHNQVNELLCVTITSFFFLAGLLLSFKNKTKKYYYLLAILSAFLLAELVLNISGSFVLITRYTLIILPVLLLLSIDGLMIIKNKIIKYGLIGIILLIFTYNIIDFRETPSFANRLGGYKIAGDILNQLNLKNDYVIYPNRSELLKKYAKDNNFIAFDIPGILYLDKTKQEALKAFNKDFVLSTNTKNSLEKLTPYLIQTKPSPELEKYIATEISRIPTGKKLVFIDDYSFIPALSRIDFIKKVNEGKIDKSIYNEILFYFAYEKIDTDVKNILDKSPKLEKITSNNLSLYPYCSKKWHFTIYKKK